MAEQVISTATGKPRNFLKTVFLTGLLAGVLDATAAMIQFMIRTNGGNPLKVWRFVASGIFGKEVATKNIWAMAGWGLLFHFFIAFCFTLFFFLIYPKIKLLSKNLISTGLCYGIFVWLIMNRIVVPLSNTTKIPFNLTQAIIGAGILMVCIGLPVSLLVGRYYSKLTFPH